MGQIYIKNKFNKQFKQNYQCLSNWTICAPHLVAIQNVAPIYTISFAFHTNNIRAS